MSNSKYKDALSEAMQILSENEKVIFLGQGVSDTGTFMSTTLEELPNRVELPVMEETQMGMCIGLALDGYIPVSVYPRYNFIVSAMSQLVNHLNVMQPHVIVRVGIGSTMPLDPGPQHKGDFTEAFRLLLPNVVIVKLDRAEIIIDEYKKALLRKGPTILVEIANLYED